MHKPFIKHSSMFFFNVGGNVCMFLTKDTYYVIHSVNKHPAPEIIAGIYFICIQSLMQLVILL